MSEKLKMPYAGADWVENEMHHAEKDFKISPLGRAVADFLGELFLGIYHLDISALHKVEWGNNHHIIVSIGWKSWATYDYDLLTRLVFLAHHMALRVELQPSRNQYVRLMFHQKSRSGKYESHPTLRQAVERFEAGVNIPEFVDAEDKA